jgi:hypothetical protein
VSHAEQDADLISLRDDPRFHPLVDAAKARMRGTNDKLRGELQEMSALDQAARKRIISTGSPELARIVEDVDRVNTARLKQILDESGWPTITRVGVTGAHDAWLLAQHADRDPALQKRCLDLMATLVKTGEATAKDWAYLVDRVAIAEGKKQIYGTQFGPDHRPLPLEDEAHVDARRRQVGLGTLADYAAQMAR